MKSWKTTSCGIIAILVSILTAAQAILDGNPATAPDIGSVIAAVMAGVGLLAARDNNVSSEQAGAK